MKAKLNVFLLSINVGKILLHALSITRHASKFWLQVKVQSYICFCLVASHSFSVIMVARQFFSAGLISITHVDLV